MGDGTGRVMCARRLACVEGLGPGLGSEERPTVSRSDGSSILNSHPASICRMKVEDRIADTENKL